jgi:1,4-dihydroxy-2-naphthoyl-CoA synthase
MTGDLREPLDVRRRGAGLRLTLNRPAARNGLDADLAAALGAALDAAERDSAIAAVVITAAGRVFCAAPISSSSRGWRRSRPARPPPRSTSSSPCSGG